MDFSLLVLFMGSWSILPLSSGCCLSHPALMPTTQAACSESHPQSSFLAPGLKSSSACSQSSCKTKWTEGFLQHTEQGREGPRRPAINEAAGKQSKKTQVFTSASLASSKGGIICCIPGTMVFSGGVRIRDGHCSEVAQSVQNLNSLHVAVNARV